MEPAGAAAFRVRPVLLALLTLHASLFAAADAVPAGTRVYDVKWLSLGRWRMPFYNDGRFGIDVSGGDRAGGCWPRPYRNQYLYGAGFWFGSLCRAEVDTTRQDTLVSVGYNPNSHTSEMAPGPAAKAYLGGGSRNDRMFVYPSDWPPRPRDWLVTGPDIESLVPAENVSLGDLWCVYTDALAENHLAPGRPLDIDVYQSVYVWNLRLSEDIFFVVWQVRNSGTDTLRRCFVGAVSDPDIGAPADDRVGLLLDDSIPGAPRVRRVAYCGDYDNAESSGELWERGTPGVLAYRFLESPRGRSGAQLGMTALKKFSRTVDPLKDAGQYLTMAGYDYRTGIYAPFDSGPDEEVGDKRFLMASGPFDLLPGQVERLAVACFAAPYGGSGQRWDQRPRDSLAHLARTAAAAQFVYDAGWVLAGPPAMPNVTLVPGDNQARIVWDDVAERRPDPYWERVASNPENPAWDPMYRRYDFQGYAVYRSDDAEHWRRLAGFDLDDGIAFRYPANGDSAQPDSLWLEATDTGLGHSFLDASARNGFQYYYYVAAYDWNYQTTAWDSLHRTPVAWDTLVFATGPRTDLVTIPRWDAADFGLPRVRVVTALGDTTNPALRCSASVVVPFAAVRETCEMRFFGPGWTGAGDRPGCRYVVTAGDSLLVDTARFDVDVGASGPTRARSPVVNGIELDFTVAMAPPRRAFDAVEVARGRYPAESLRTGAAPQQAWWAFRGSDYEVAWTNAGGYLTARVLDATHGGIEVPYAPFTTTGQGPRNADGWCFVDRSLRVPSETLDAGAAQTYVCGGYFQFRPGPTDTLGPLLARIEAGDTWRLTGHRAEGSAPFHNRYHVIAGRDSAAARPAGLNVKVVPNPFIVYDDWQQSSQSRVVRFTHLPSRCVVRVYTVSGDLVRTIEHSDTRNQPQDQGGTATWNLTTDSHLVITSGVYIYHVESEVGEFVGKLAVIR